MSSTPSRDWSRPDSPTPMTAPLAAAGKQPPVNIRRSRHRFRRTRDLWLMILPCILFFLVFHYAPMYGAIIAFKDYRVQQGIFGSQWVGLANFAKLFSEDEFPRALRNTVIISLLRLSFGFVAPIVLALMLNEVRKQWYKRTIQTVTYLPYFLSWVILGGIFALVFSADGPVNNALNDGFGFFHWLWYQGSSLFVANPAPYQSITVKIPFLEHPAWFLFVLILTGIWQSVGYGAVIYLAALSGINPQLYEAAMIDGANRWKQTLHVTLPALVPTIITLFILNVGHILNAGFDQVYNMHKPLVYEWSDIIDTYVLRQLELLNFSVGTAAGLFKSVVGLGMIVLVNSIARRMSDNELGVF